MSFRRERFRSSGPRLLGVLVLVALAVVLAQRFVMHVAWVEAISTGAAIAMIFGWMLFFTDRLIR